MKDVVDMAEELNNNYNLVVDFSYLDRDERLYLHNSPIENWRYIGVSSDDPWSQTAKKLYYPRYTPIHRLQSINTYVNPYVNGNINPLLSPSY